MHMAPNALSGSPMTKTTIIKDSVARVRRNPGSARELGRLARDVGHLLNQLSVHDLRNVQALLGAFQAELSRVVTAGGRYANGVIFALLELCSAVESEALAAEDRNELRAILSDSFQVKVLSELRTGDKGIEELASSLRCTSEVASAAVLKLEIAGLLEGGQFKKGTAERRTSFRLTPFGYMLAPASQSVSPTVQIARSVLIEQSREKVTASSKGARVVTRLKVSAGGDRLRIRPAGRKRVRKGTLSL